MPKENEMPKIKIELELDPPIALLLGMFIHQSSQGSMDPYAMLTDDGKNSLMKIGQSITDQVANKTKFPKGL